MSIIIKSPREIDIMRQAGRIVATVLQALSREIKPGMKTQELDDICIQELAKHGARASFKGYQGFPSHMCISINNEVVHGIPGEQVLHQGDIVSLDVGAIYEGFQGDAAITIGVGKINHQADALLRVTEGALMVGITAARNKAYLGDISAAIEIYVESNGFSVVREYTGHGIGREMHEEPQIPNFGSSGQGPLLRRGMTLAIEPMVNAGDWHTKRSDNQWTVTTVDGSLSAHFEHTIAITDAEPEILTRI
jgi:methionyl aminopeptidase